VSSSIFIRIPAFSFSTRILTTLAYQYVSPSHSIDHVKLNLEKLMSIGKGEERGKALVSKAPVSEFKQKIEGKVESPSIRNSLDSLCIPTGNADKLIPESTKKFSTRPRCTKYLLVLESACSTFHFKRPMTGGGGGNMCNMTSIN